MSDSAQKCLSLCINVCIGTNMPFYALKCPSTKLCKNKMPSDTKMPAHLCIKFFAPQCTSSISLTYFPLYILLPILLTYTPGESVYLNSSELCKNVWNMLVSIQCPCTKVPLCVQKWPFSNKNAFKLSKMSKTKKLHPVRENVCQYTKMPRIHSRVPFYTQKWQSVQEVTHLRIKMTHLPLKCPSAYKNACFCTKMPLSAQKCFI